METRGEATMQQQIEKVEGDLAVLGDLRPATFQLNTTFVGHRAAAVGPSLDKSTERCTRSATSERERAAANS